MSDETITFLVLGATVAVFIWDRLPVAVVAVGVALAVGDRRARARPGARRVRRSDRCLHCVALRRQPGPGRIRGDDMGRTAADRAGGREPRADPPADDDALRCPHGADHGQRCGRSARARRRRDGGAASPRALAAPHAAGVRRACRVAAGSDRVARQRDRLGGGRRRRCRPDRLLRLRARRHPAPGKDHRDRRPPGRATPPPSLPAFDAGGLRRSRTNAGASVRARRGRRPPHAGAGSRRGGDPAAVGVGRPARVHRDGDRERRPRRPRRAAPRRGATRRDDAGRRRHAAPRRHLESARRAPRRPGRSRG